MRQFSAILLMIAGISIPSISYAKEAESPVIPKPLNVMPVKIKPVQDSADEMSKAAPDSQTSLPEADNQHLETLNPREGFGFPSNFWQNSSRKEIANFLSKPSKVSPNKIVRDLQLRAVLTPAPQLSAPTSTDKNLYALRLQSLVNLGDFDDAITLYKLNDGLPPTPLAAQAGTEAMLGKGEIAIACLEQKALDKSLKSDMSDFWNRLDILCQALLSPVAGTDDSMRLTNAARVYLNVTKTVPPTDVTALNATDSISTIALIKSNHISGLLDSAEKINLLSDKQLATALTYVSEGSPIKLPLVAASLKRGITASNDALTMIGTLDLEKVSEGYRAFLKEYTKQKPPILTFSLLSMATTPEKQDLLLPLYSAAEIAFPEKMIPLSLQLLTRANQSLPASLVRTAFSIPESTESDKESGEFLLFTHLWEQTQQAENANYLTLLAIKPFYIPENTSDNAYDNNFNLTGDSNYVMPTSDILRELIKSAKEKQTDQVVVNSLEILTETPLEKLNPLAFYRILEALDSAGLTEETLSLSRYALGALLEKN